VLPVFIAFRVMVGIGVLMLLVAWWGAWLAWRGQLEHSRAFLRVAQWMAPSGFIAVLAGWTVTEVGRQPWTVYGLLRTADSLTPTITGTDVALSLAFYVVVYAIVYTAAGIYLLRLVRQGPAAAAAPPDPTARPARPLSAAGEV
jgi:cytochrome d ubiquinol oxidase subunit I